MQQKRPKTREEHIRTIDEELIGLDQAYKKIKHKFEKKNKALE